MSRSVIKTVKTVSKDGKVKLTKWYIGPSMASPFPQYGHSNRVTWDGWPVAEDTFGMDGELYSIVSDEILGFLS